MQYSAPKSKKQLITMIVAIVLTVAVSVAGIIYIIVKEPAVDQAPSIGEGTPPSSDQGTEPDTDDTSDNGDDSGNTNGGELIDPLE